MIKKSLVVIGVFGLIQMIVMACCPDPITYYNSINELMVANYSLDEPGIGLDDGASVLQRDYRIVLRIDHETFEQAFNSSGLMNAAYATSCPSNFVGLMSDIVEFKITCNKNILGAEAGEPIDFDKIRVYKIGFTEDSKNQRMTIGEWLEVLNDGGYLLAFEWYFEFNEPVNSSDFLKFEMSITQKDGSAFTVETQSVRIQ